MEEGADAATATGSREDPYATIGAAMTAAVRGRRHRRPPGRLPGTGHDEASSCRLYSAATSSTDSTVFTTSTGDALSTIIRAPFVASPPAGTYATITASGIYELRGLVTEIAGFTIASPLVIEPGKRNDQPERRRRQHHEFRHHARQGLRDRRRYRRRR